MKYILTALYWYYLDYLKRVLLGPLYGRFLLLIEDPLIMYMNLCIHRVGYFRELIAQYGDEMVKLCGRLMKILSTNLGLGEEYLQNAFGGENIGACLRVNFYPKCPQPDLTLGLSSHSDPGGLTLLLPDENVSGLQVRKGKEWITVKPIPNAFIVNIGDQIQVSLSLSVQPFPSLF